MSFYHGISNYVAVITKASVKLAEKCLLALARFRGSPRTSRAFSRERAPPCRPLPHIYQLLYIIYHDIIASILVGTNNAATRWMTVPSANSPGFPSCLSPTPLVFLSVAPPASSLTLLRTSVLRRYLGKRTSTGHHHGHQSLVLHGPLIPMGRTRTRLKCLILETRSYCNAPAKSSKTTLLRPSLDSYMLLAGNVCGRKSLNLFLPIENRCAAAAENFSGLDASTVEFLNHIEVAPNTIFTVKSLHNILDNRYSLVSEYPGIDLSQLHLLGSKSLRNVSLITEMLGIAAGDVSDQLRPCPTDLRNMKVAQACGHGRPSARAYVGTIPGRRWRSPYLIDGYMM